MKVFLFTTGLALLTSLSFSQNRKIEFEPENFADIKAKAKKENKIIFIDAYTTWCGPCKWMDKNIFTNDTVADYFNSTLVNAKIDMEGEVGLEIAKAYQVRCYPTYLFLDSDGKLLHRIAGTKKAAEFIEVAKTATDPKTRFSHYESDLTLKKEDSDFLKEYINALANTCLNYDEVLNTYFTSQKPTDLSNRKNWNMMMRYTVNHQSTEFNYLLSNSDEFAKKYTLDSVNYKIKNVFMSSAQKLVYDPTKDKSEIESLLEHIKSAKVTEKDFLIFQINLMNYQVKKEWEEYCKLATKDGNKYFKSLREYNTVAWNVYEHSDQTSQLKKMAEWMKREIAISVAEDDWYAYDTYASILFKLKDKSEAKLMAEKAIEKAKKIGRTEADYQGTLDLLLEIEKMK